MPSRFLRLPWTTLLLALLLASPGGNAAEGSFLRSLWDTQPPGSIPSETYKESQLFRPNDPVFPRLTKVSHPTLEAFLPAPGKGKGAAVVICPGGAYAVLSYEPEGGAVARWFQERGIAAFVLKYRLPSDEIMKDRKIGPLQDVQEAIRTVRRHANEWHVDPSKIGVMGFSAGGHLAASASTRYEEQIYPVSDNVSARPDFSILIYAVISMQPDITHVGSRNNLIGEKADKSIVDLFSNELRVNPRTPPVFLVHAQDDKTVPVENSIRYFQAMTRNGVPGELHIYEKGGHGFGLKGPAAHWTSDLGKWLESRSLM